MTTKICNNCKKELPKEDFYKLSGKNYKEHWDCRSSLCKKCSTRAVIQQRRDIKSQCVNYKGNKCADCGYTSDKHCVFDFHHLDPSQKEFSFGNKLPKFEKLIPELDKCVLLCAVCHRLRHYE